ncbi:hypothetical protein CDAR_81981 [Caerostris darwini]|uniref:Uncharacterized protein n=1 Tax=Caerostris darwini TaxID=1538125 RepID=A0AAV4V638_9ARAC|nr:hypothetical protein CDAR_81981 [Caerostris darwini]
MSSNHRVVRIFSERNHLWTVFPAFTSPSPRTENTLPRRRSAVPVQKGRNGAHKGKTAQRPTEVKSPCEHETTFQQCFSEVPIFTPAISRRRSICGGRAIHACGRRGSSRCLLPSVKARRRFERVEDTTGIVKDKYSMSGIQPMKKRRKFVRNSHFIYLESFEVL